MKHEVDELILWMLSQRPRSQAEIQHASPLSDFGTIYRLQRLEIQKAIVSERSGNQHSTIYRLAPAKEENENKKENPTVTTPDKQVQKNVNYKYD